MLFGQVFLAFLYIGISFGSVGDRLPEFTHCLEKCNRLLCLENDPTGSVSNEIELKETFENSYSISGPFKHVFFWDCQSDCKYKCEQLVTDQREKNGLEVVQFYGKWPFIRIFGMQELFSVLFSIANFQINYINLFKVMRHYNRIKLLNSDWALMLRQYLQLIVVSLIGWTFSTLFHMRDNPLTETLDYFGAAAIIMSNFNAIFIRYFGLYKNKHQLLRKLFQSILMIIFIFHCVKLKKNWDYDYNVKYNLFFGVSAMILWILHAIRVQAVYLENFYIFNNSIQLVPFETKILTKLNYLSLSESKYIPLLPVALNIWIVLGMSFELLDFVPFRRLIDAHALWHLFTVFPTIIWYDWNIWDIEMFRINEEADKLS